MRMFINPTCCIKVNINIIMPGSYPNSINCGNGGNVPVAVFSTPDFDATTIVRDTVRFAGAPPLPIGESPQDINGDGLLDVVFDFEFPVPERDYC